MAQEYKIVHYEENSRDFFKEWLKDLIDMKAKTAIYRAIKRMKQGNFGDHKFCRDGVWELRIHVSTGYRVYYSVIENVIILLLCGGTKKTQDKDIDKAVEYLKNFKES